ncbi:hypothetical protein FJV82_18545 [Mesorhizobium sp. WSM4305]|nr:hypothetical protein FJV82_18545 [Mesorhizobium sp. WSM4305]
MFLKCVWQGFSFSSCGRRWPRETRSDEGCSRERQRLTPLEHSSTVSALRADPPSPTRGEGRASRPLRRLRLFLWRPPSRMARGKSSQVPIPRKPHDQT